MTTLYISRLVKIAEQAAEANASAFEAASSALAATLTGDGLVHLFGSGHSVLPTQETYPRYGSYIGFNPLTDPRVMWHNVLGPGGVRELLWLERTEGYAEKFLDHQPLNPGDSIVIFGHSGRNASGIDTAIYAKKRGLTVVAITAKANLDKPATHSSGKRLADAADIVIDTGAPIEDAIVPIEGWSRPVAGSSTVLAMMMMHELLARTAAEAQREKRRVARVRFAHHRRRDPARHRPHLRTVPGADDPRSNEAPRFFQGENAGRGLTGFVRRKARAPACARVAPWPILELPKVSRLRR